MVITKEAFDRVFAKAGRTMLDEWLPSHLGVVDETERHIEQRRVIFASRCEHDVWMMWLALSIRGYESIVYVAKSGNCLEIRKKLTTG